MERTERRTGPTVLGPDSPIANDTAQRAFNYAIIVSGVRCILAYVLLPFATPFIGLAPGVGPLLGIGISVIAIGANLVSLRRFARSSHRWRKPVIGIHIAVIGLLVVLIGIDLTALA